MQVTMLDAIARIRTEMISVGKCCMEFKVTREMLNNLGNSNTVYALDTTQEEEEMEMFS